MLTLLALAVSQPTAPLVRLGQVNLSFYRVAGEVVAEVFTRLGYRVERVEGSHAEIFPKLRDGSVDVLVAAWLPTGHGPYWREAGASVTELGVLYRGARFFWAVPTYVPAVEVASIADLAKPEVARRMRTEIRSIGADSGLSRLSEAAFAAYGLGDAGYRFATGDPAKWVGGFREAFDQMEWVVMPLWQPQWLNRAYPLRALRDPKNALGGEDRAVLAANRDFARGLPARDRRVLGRIALGVDAVTEMDHAVNVGGRTPREAAADWMSANARRVEKWF